jgi:hypothetical protein
VRHADAGPYAHFEWTAADTRSVVTTSGTGQLASWQPLGAEVHLDDMTPGTRVVVRTNYHPAWTARHLGRSLRVTADNGQLAFDAPAAGSYVVELVYPSRRWLLVVASAGLLAGIALLRRIR